MAASIAYYAVFSLAPLLVIVVGVASRLFGRAAAEGLVVDRLNEALGSEGAAFVQSMLAQAYSSKGTVMATALAVLVLLFAASRVIGAMRGALNDVWGVKGRAGGGVKGYIVTKIFDLGMVLVIGIAFMATMMANAVASAVAGRFIKTLPVPDWALTIAGIAFSLVVVAFFITIVFRVLPNTRVPWRDTLLGATVTAVLFGIGNYVIGLYLGRISVSSIFGAAGALAVLMMWTYYIAQIVLFGAEITRAHHDRRHSPTARQTRR
jgi:membrane protein